MAKDLHAPGDGGWLTQYPAPDQAIPLGEGRVYPPEDGSDGDDLVVFTFGNAVPMCLRAQRAWKEQLGWSTRIVDLRWLQPLNEGFIAEQAKSAKRILVVDEGRRSAGVGEGIITAIVEAGLGATPLKRVVGADTFTPLAGAAFLVLPGDEEIIAAGRAMA
jgi:2-oxoisovalerate dehydrogenase E1 component